MRNPNRTLVGLALLGLGARAAAQADEWAIAPPPGTIVMKEELLRLGRAQNDVVKEGLAAQRRGDYATAERDFRRACTFLGHDQSFQHLWLARLFDLTGDDRRAYGEYRTVVVGDPLSFSTDQTDPANLARLGDLCLRYGTVEDARRAYGLAIANGARQTYGDPVAFARTDTVNGLRAAAHTAAAIQNYWRRSEARFQSEIMLAMESDDGNWVTRIWHAAALHNAHRDVEATKEAMVAEGMVSGRERELVQQMRYSRRIVDAEGHLPPMPVANPAPKKGGP